MTIIPFSCLFLLTEAAWFLGTGHVRLVVDFTHDVCQQKFKLGMVSFAGDHFVRGFCRSRVLPVFYCLSSKENTSACLPLLQVVFEEFQSFAVDLRSKATDGAVAAKRSRTPASWYSSCCVFGTCKAEFRQEREARAQRKQSLGQIQSH